MAGFITDDGVGYLLGLFGNRETVVPTYYLTLTRSVPAPYMSVEDLDEVDAEDYLRAAYSNDGSTWTLSLDTLANAHEVTFPVAAADWGDVTGWALLDTSDVGTGRILYGGDLATTWTIEADTQPVMEPGQLAVTISVSDWALEG